MEQGQLQMITHKVLIDDEVVCIGTEKECEDRAAAIERRGWCEPGAVKVEELG